MKKESKWKKTKSLQKDEVKIAPMTVKTLEKAFRKMEKEHNKTYKSIIKGKFK